MVDVARTMSVLLKEYPAFLKVLQGAQYVGKGKLVCQLKVTPGWSYVGPPSAINHFTATEATLAHNQMAYVALACMAQEGELPGVQQLALDVMNQKKLNSMLIQSMSLNFVAPFDSAKSFVGLFEVKTCVLKKSRAEEGYVLFTSNVFSFADGKSTGTSSAAIKLTKNELLSAMLTSSGTVKKAG